MFKKIFLWGCLLMVLGTCAVIKTPTLKPVDDPYTPTSECSGESIWELYNFGAPGNTVEFRYQQRYDSSCQCKHYFRVRSRCTLYEVEYTTFHSVTMCPMYNLVAVSQPAVNLLGCPSAALSSAEAAIVSAYSPVPKNGGYCLNLSTPPGTVYWGGYEPTWVFGPRRVWFS